MHFAESERENKKSVIDFKRNTVDSHLKVNKAFVNRIIIRYSEIGGITKRHGDGSKSEETG